VVSATSEWPQRPEPLIRLWCDAHGSTFGVWLVGAKPSSTGRPGVGLASQRYDARVSAEAGRRALSPEDILLLLADGATGQFALDPVRLMKGTFLVVERGRAEWRGLFRFEAYDYGPFDRHVYDARDRLIVDGLLEVIPGRYDSYRLTQLGRERARELSMDLGGDADWMRRIGRYVTTRSFEQLLTEVYDAHPEYAVRSRFRS
jgi:hypothetical protein